MIRAKFIDARNTPEGYVPCVTTLPGETQRKSYAGFDPGTGATASFRDDASFRMRMYASFIPSQHTGIFVTGVTGVGS